MTTLIRNATLVSAGPLGRIVPDGYMRITDGQIAQVGMGSVSPGPGEKLVEGRGRVVFRGLINTHAHLFQSLLKGLGADRQLYDWLSSMIAPSVDELTTEDCYLLAFVRRAGRTRRLWGRLTTKGGGRG